MAPENDLQTPPSDTPSAAEWSPPVEGGGTTSWWRQPWVWLTGAGVAAVLVGIGVALLVMRPQPQVPGQPGPAAPPPDPEAIAVTLANLTVDPTGNEALFGQESPDVDSGAVDTAVSETLTVLQDYLNAVFINPETRFTQDAVDTLLAPDAVGALSPRDARALGVLDLSVEKSEGAPVQATATAVADADGVVVVTLTYAATVDVTLTDGGTAQITQEAEMAFTPQRGGWAATAVDATLDAPDGTEDAQ